MNRKNKQRRPRPARRPRIILETPNNARNSQNIVKRTQRYTLEVKGSKQLQSWCHLFKLNAIDSTSLSAITTLYDQYKVASVKIRWIPSVTSAAITIGSASGSVFVPTAPMMYSVCDFDDSLSLSSLAQIKAYSRMTMKPVTKPQHRYFRPYVRELVTQNGKFDTENCASKISRSGWLDLAFTGVEHLGSKWMLEPIPGISESSTFPIGTFEIEAVVLLRTAR